MAFLKSGNIPIRHGAQQQGIRRACQVARDVLIQTASQVHVGVTTAEIDRFAAAKIKELGATSAFLGYRQFPGNICVSINEEVVHGIGGPRVIQDGDIVKIDVGVYFDGWVGDNALSVPVGNVAKETLHLLAATEESLLNAVKYARDGWMLGDLCHSVEHHVTQYGYSVVREFVGHGVGRKLHEEPQVPNYGKKGERPRLKAGMTLAIEPMINMGTGKTRILEDKWTVVTQDRKPSAHFEHVVLITPDEPEILTARGRMFPKGTADLTPRPVADLG
ncbi:type I methionyl aminopeptidase [Prosthecobacter sp.]|uniref:type I methionyl aminopeptidase n=1 Tax=Prosthecobacter sp. TaxID=1965333 RepID=UPI001D7FD08C|nr:type I methionyl aminopeptidase [Prosthecobacter sp.]MCB1275131.1 type I methionyl aminopeptidase [Prosthecobacter sp.]